MLSAQAENSVLVPPTSFVFGGEGTHRTLTITPASGRVGITSVTVTANDADGESRSVSFRFAVEQFSRLETVPHGWWPAPRPGATDDDDGDLDLLLTDIDSLGPSQTYRLAILRQEGADAFTRVQTEMRGVSSGRHEWIDLDRDGDLDVSVSGMDAWGGFMLSYFNQGADQFSPTSINLPGVISKADSWADFDNDGDMDALVPTSTDWPPSYLTILYRNEGLGRFTDSGIQFPTAFLGASAWADYDGDGDLDLALSGNSRPYDYAEGRFTRIYRNDGGECFAELSAPLLAADQGCLAWADWDLDGRIDLLVVGLTDQGPATRLYRNDGRDTFSDVPVALPGVLGGAAWGDYDNDGWPDLLLTGTNGTGGITRVLRNLGDGRFDQLEADLAPTINGSVVWGDIEGDGDLDFVVGGANAFPSHFTAMYRNNQAQPNQQPQPPALLSAVTSSATQNDVTLLWSRGTDPEAPDNQGLTYNLRVGTAPGRGDIVAPQADPLTGARAVPAFGAQWASTNWTLFDLPGSTYFWSVQTVDAGLAGSAFAPEQSFVLPNRLPRISDIPDTGTVRDRPTAELPFTIQDRETASADLVLMATSSDPGVIPEANVQFGGSGTNRTVTVQPAPNATGRATLTVTVHDQHGGTANDTFSVSVEEFSATTNQFPGLSLPALAWVDLDSDKDLDFIVTGERTTGVAQLFVGRNQGAETFLLVTNPITAVTSATIAWGDVDNDGDLDLALAGNQSDGTSLARLYANSGDGALTNAPFALPQFNNGALAWGDVDNDGDLDLLLAGDIAAGQGLTRLYLNEGEWRFKETPIPLPPLRRPILAWGDYDGDGDLDLLCAGVCAAFPEGTTRIYRNTEGLLMPTGVNLPPVYAGAGAWGDMDNDGDLDLVLVSASFSGIFRNDAPYTFVDLQIPLPQMTPATVVWGDIDNDGLLDILINGSVTADAVAMVWLNQGQGRFMDACLANLVPLSNGALALGDYDSDGDVDFLMSGMQMNPWPPNPRMTILYRNNAAVLNLPPAPPANLRAVVTGNRALLSWDPAADDHTPPHGLRYQVRLGTSPGLCDIVSPPADPLSGWRRLAMSGAALVGTGWEIRRLAPGTYYWSVQAIDTALTGSAFAPDQSFVILPPPEFTGLSLLPGDRIRLDLAAPGFIQIVFERTVDCLNWSPVATNDVTAGRTEFIGQQEGPQEFYRARVVR